MGKLKQAINQDRFEFDEPSKDEIAARNKQAVKQAEIDTEIRHKRNAQRIMYFTAIEGMAKDPEALKRDFRQLTIDIEKLGGKKWWPKEKKDNKSFGIHEK